MRRKPKAPLKESSLMTSRAKYWKILAKSTGTDTGDLPCAEIEDSEILDLDQVHQGNKLLVYTLLQCVGAVGKLATRVNAKLHERTH